MDMSKYTPETIERAVTLARRGHSRAVIERVTGMKTSSIAYHSAKSGVTSPRSNQGHRTAFAPGARPFSQQDDTALMGLRAQGFGYLRIAKMLRRNRSSIRSRCLTLQQRDNNSEEGDL